MNDKLKVLREDELFLSGKGLLPKSYRLMSIYKPKNIYEYSNIINSEKENEITLLYDSKRANIYKTVIIGMSIIVISVYFISKK